MKVVICLTLIVILNIVEYQAALIDSNDGKSRDLKQAIKENDVFNIDSNDKVDVGHLREKRAAIAIGRVIGKVLKKVKGKGTGKGKGKGKGRRGGQASISIEKKGKNTKVNGKISTRRTDIQGNVNLRKGKKPNGKLTISRKF